MRTLLLIVICAIAAAAAQAQTGSMAKPKIYISNSNDWQQAGGFKATAKMPAQAATDEPDTAHVDEVSALTSQCSTTEVTSDASKANYILLWDTKAIWNALSARTNLLIMYTPKGDAVYSVRSDSRDAAARHVCAYLAKSAAPPAKPTPAKPAAAAAPAKPAPSPATAAAANKSGL